MFWRPNVQRPRIFEPALKQFGGAFRNGEPRFVDSEQGVRWRAARRRVMDHVLEIIGGSSRNESLVLRGSVLLAVWLAESAREPADLDFFIRPSTIKSTDSWTDGLIRCSE